MRERPTRAELLKIAAFLAASAAWTSACTKAPAGFRRDDPSHLASGDASSPDTPKPTSDAAVDNPTVGLLKPIDGGSLNAGPKDVPFHCVPGVFCKRQQRGQENCGTLTLTLDIQPQRTPINLLLVFDQSLSMGDAWGDTGQTKIEAARAAIADTVASLTDVLNVGAIFFPTYACGRTVRPRSGGVVAPIDGPGQIPFQPAMQFLNAWNQHWGQGTAPLTSGTPLQEAFDRADQALQASSLVGPMVVVAVTDGEPNCTADPTYTMIPTAAETDRAKSWLTSKDIDTYVVGLPGASGTQLLNDIASSGGTSEYILPDNPMVLEAKLQGIVQTSVQTHAQACMIDLVPPAFNPVSQLKLDLFEVNGAEHDNVPHMISATAGWAVSSDGVHVQFTGDLCAQVSRGEYSAVTFDYGCDHSTTPPPPQLN